MVLDKMNIFSYYITMYIYLLFNFINVFLILQICFSYFTQIKYQDPNLLFITLQKKLKLYSIKIFFECFIQ